MYNTSTAYKNEIKKPSRSFECKITIGDKVFKNEDIVDIILETVQPQEGFMIGSTTSQTLDLTLLNKGDSIYSTNQIKLEIGLKIGNTIEYILMGYYNIDDIEKTDYTTKFAAFDNMIKFESAYFSNLEATPTLQQVVNELATKTGVQFIGSLPAYTVKKLEGFTCREILSYVASLCGGNATITRDGKFTIVYPKDIGYSITADNYFDYKREEVRYKIGKVTCQTKEKETISKGSLGTDSMEVLFENPWVTDSILQDIYNKLNGFEYLGYSTKWQGDLSLDVGDIITCTDKKGVVRKLPILSQKLAYTGGLTSEIGAKGESKNKNSYNSSGDNSKKLSRVVTELALVNKAFVDYAHINDADITNLRAKDVEIQNALIEKADVKELKAIDADIDKLYAKDAAIDKALIGKADIIDLNAVKADINILDADVGNIKTLTAGNISADNIKADFLQTLEGWMLEGSIGNAQISDLNANKIKSGTVDTSLVTVASKDNSITLTGNQLMVNDTTVPTTPKNRIVLGKYQKTDGTWAYGLLVRAEDGQTVMLDGYGVHNAGLTSDAIKDNVVADDANISGNKLDINSVIRSVNGSTEKISSTVVQAGEKTLNVLLQEQTNTITEHGKSLSTQEARITANEKAINLKVDSQTYTSDKTTINKSIEATLTNSKAYADTKKGEAISTAATDATSKANNAKDTAISDSKAYVNQEITTVNSNLSKATSEINVLKGQISLKVEQGDIDKTVTTQINNLEVGGRNYVRKLGGESYDLSSIYSQDRVNTVFETIDNKIWAKVSKSDHLRIAPIEIEPNKTYTWSFNVYTTGSDTEIFCHQWDNNAYSGQRYKISSTATRIKHTFISESDSRYEILHISSLNTGDIYYFSDFKLEKGNKSTDWTPAPEDTYKAIADVITTTDTKINTAKSEIKAETDKIKLSVNGLDSTTKAIETQMNDKATKSEIKVVSDKASSIEANLGSITQRVSSTESKVNTVETSAKKANDKIDGLEISGRNLLIGDRIVTYTPYNPIISRQTSKKIVSRFSPDSSNSATVFTLAVSGFDFKKEPGQYTLSGYLKVNDKIPQEKFFKNYASSYGKDVIENYYNADTGYFRITQTYVTSSAWIMHAPTTSVASNEDIVTLEYLKFEKGNKATAWSPAPEDVDQAISAVNETVTNKFSEITSTMSDITQKVSSVEKTTSTLNGTVASQEARIKVAENKITDNAIINTVKDARTDGKATFATTSSVEQLSDQVNFKFNSVGSPNLLRNSYIENFDTSGWSISGLTKYFSNAPFFTPSQGWVAFDLTGGTYGADRGLFYQYLNGRYCPERNTDYTFSLSSITEGNIERFLIYIDYCKNGQYVYNQQFDLPIGYKQERHGILFTTPNGEFDEVRFYLDFRRKSGTSGYKVVSIGLPCLCRGSSTAYNNRANEVYTGNTRVSADGVTIYNGALTVVNKSGQNVISADSNGDISFRGKLQPNDYQVKLFGNNCQIDGSAGAVRMQLTPQIYMAMDSAGYMRIYNQRSSGGTNYVSLGVNNEGHTILFCGRTMLKLLGGSQPGVQARWGGDGGYCPMQASDFINNSTIKAKTNISSLNIENAINIIKENNIRNYQLKSDIDNDGLDHEKTLWDSNAPIKTGLIIEELTPQAKDMLVPSDTDCISLYSMVSLLWGVVQNNQNELEKQQEQIDNLQRQIDELKKIKI